METRFGQILWRYILAKPGAPGSIQLPRPSFPDIDGENPGDSAEAGDRSGVFKLVVQEEIGNVNASKSGLESRAKQIINTARSRARQNRSHPAHGDILAEVSFGFWRYLTSKRYLTTLWLPALQRAFPHGNEDAWTRQKQVSNLIGRMTFLRNRAAHLEPVFRRDVQQDIDQARLLLSWVSPDASLWFDDTLGDDFRVL